MKAHHNAGKYIAHEHGAFLRRSEIEAEVRAKLSNLGRPLPLRPPTTGALSFVASLRSRWGIIRVMSWGATN